MMRGSITAYYQAEQTGVTGPGIGDDVDGFVVSEFASSGHRGETA
jgi:hypothetical protein